MENHSVFNSKELANDIVHFIEERIKLKARLMDFLQESKQLMMQLKV